MNPKDQLIQLIKEKRKARLIVTPLTSTIVQKICFENNIGWSESGKIILHTEQTNLALQNSGEHFSLVYINSHDHHYTKTYGYTEIVFTDSNIFWSEDMAEKIIQQLKE